LVAFQRALDLLQYDPFKLADRSLSRALAQDHGGGERALDDGLEVAAIPRAPPRVSRFARLEARGHRRGGGGQPPPRRARAREEPPARPPMPPPRLALCAGLLPPGVVLV